MSAKYPRSLHFPFSPGKSSDDKVMSEEEFESFVGQELVFTEKLDGSNVCLTRDACFSRSHSGIPTHPSFDLFKKIHSQICQDIDPGISIFAEYVFAVHTIKYMMLPHYLFIIGVRNDRTNEWLSVDETKTYSDYYNIPTVPILLRGVVGNKKQLKTLIEDFGNLSSIYGSEREGLVIRYADAISVPLLNFIGLGKWVRLSHAPLGSINWTTAKLIKQPCLRFF